MRALSLIRVLIILSAITLPLALTFVQSGKTIQWMQRFEQRKFSPLPSLELSVKSVTSAPAAFEAYVNDRFGLRSTLISLHSHFLLRVLGVSPTPKLVLGRDGWFFPGRGKEKLQGNEFGEYDELMLNSEESANSLGKMIAVKSALEARQAHLEEIGSAYLFSIIPGKISIYSDFLDSRFAAARPARKGELLAQYLLKHANINFTDLFTPLRDARKEVPEHALYLKTDGHWNGLGAYFAYRALMAESARLFPQQRLQAAALENFHIRNKEPFFHPAFTALAGVKLADSYTYLVPKDLSVPAGVKGPCGKRQANGRWLSSASAGKVQGLDYRELRNLRGGPFRAILLVGDSFMEKAAPFFAAHAERVYFIRSVSKFPMEAVEKFHPELVIHGVMQGYLGALEQGSS